MNPLLPPQSPLLRKRKPNPRPPRQKLDTKTPPEPKADTKTPRAQSRHQDPPGPKADTKTPQGQKQTPRPPRQKSDTKTPPGKNQTPSPPKAKIKGFQSQRSGQEGGSRGSFRTYEILRCRRGLPLCLPIWLS